MQINYKAYVEAQMVKGEITPEQGGIALLGITTLLGLISEAEEADLCVSYFMDEGRAGFEIHKKGDWGFNKKR